LIEQPGLYASLLQAVVLPVFQTKGESATYRQSI
jgi:hypothetical protein